MFRIRRSRIPAWNAPLRVERPFVIGTFANGLRKNTGKCAFSPPAGKPGYLMSDITPSAPLNIAVLVSGQGRGTNLQALLDACAAGQVRGRIAVVIGTR